MISKAALEKEIDELEVLANTIEISAKYMFETVPIRVDRSSKFPNYFWDAIPEDMLVFQRDALRNYQRWYTVCPLSNSRQTTPPLHCMLR